MKQRREIALRNTHGVKLDETNGPMTRLCNKIDFENLIARHNDPADEYHFDLHSVVEQRKYIYGQSTADLILNAYTGGWHLCHVCI